MGDFEPRIIAFLCNWCTYTGADLAGTSRLQYPPNIRIIRLNSVPETVADLLRRLMEQDVVDALLVPQRLSTGNNVVQTLVRDPDRLERIDPFAPVMPVMSAKLAGNVTKLGAAGRVGLVMRSCELRGFIELVKLQQASMEEVITIGVDCLGTYEMTDYARLIAEGVDPTAEALAAAAEGRVAPRKGYQFRTACQMCEYPTPRFEDGYRPEECIFRTPTFDHTSEQYFRWADRKGAIRMPTDTLIFHITRMNHMSTSCVGCGMCTSACPNDIPVATAFRAVAEKTQAIYDYIAGRSLEEEVPLATFREDELTALGKRPE